MAEQKVEMQVGIRKLWAGAKQLWLGSHFESGVIYSEVELLLHLGLRELLRRKLRQVLRSSGLSKRPDRDCRGHHSPRRESVALPALDPLRRSRSLCESPSARSPGSPPKQRH